MKRKLYTYVIIIFLLISNRLASQCEVYDGLGNASSNPVWVSCSGGAYTLNFASPTTLTGYTIDWGDGSPVSSGASLTANTILPHPYAVATDTFIVTITSTTPACAVTGLVVMEKPVNASIQIPIGGVTTSCAPAALQFTNSSTDVSATTTFTWDFGDGSPLLTFNETNAGQTITHTYQKGTVNCQTIVTLSAENYCSFGNPTSAQFNPIQIYDLDEADIFPDEYIKCWPENSFTFANATTRNCVPEGNVDQRYEYWNFGDYWGLGHDSILDWGPWPPSLPRTIAYPAVGNYNIMLLDSNRCGVDTAILTISIVNPPTAGIVAPNDTTCTGSSLSFTNTSALGYSYSINFGDSPGFTSLTGSSTSHVYNVPGTYTVTLVAYIFGSGASCSDTARTVVTILPNPISAFVMLPSGMCDNINVNFTDASTNAVAWNWNFGNTNTSSAQTPSAQTYTVGVYTVSLQVTAANTCVHTSTQTVTVYQSPNADFNVANACENSGASFTDASSSVVSDPVIAWIWDFDDSGSSILQNPIHTYSTASAYDVELHITTAHCGDSITKTLTINPLPIATFTNNPENGCGPIDIDFTNTSIGASSYQWNFGNGQTSINTDPTTTYTNTNVSDTTYYVQLIATTAFGCNDTIIDSVKVFGKPQASLSYSSATGCAPVPINFTNTSIGATTYLWDFGGTQGTSTSTNPTHTYTNQTLFIQTYSITLISTNAGGCKDTSIVPININPEPLFGFSMVPDTGCTSLLVNFPSVAGAVLYEWDFGDGVNSTGQNPSHTYTNVTASPINYNVQLIATNAFNCKDTTTGVVVVNPRPTANYSTSQNAGCPQLNVDFFNTSVGASVFTWNFGDGSPTVTSNNPSHTFDNLTTTVNETYDVELLVENIYGCKDSITKTITVYPMITANFTADTPICAPVNVQFFNLSQGAATYNWDLGDGNFSTDLQPTHIYNNNGPGNSFATVVLTATSALGCTDNFIHTYVIFPSPQVSFLASPPSQLYPATNVTLNNVTPNASSFTNYWTFGDGQNSSQVNPANHTYSTWGTYIISLTMSSAFCRDSISDTIVIIPPIPIANFKGSKNGCRSLTVGFQNLSQYENSYLWHFGDGNTSNQPNPTHTYNTAGVYDVKLIVLGDGGSDTLIGIDSVTVYEIPQAAFIANPTTVGAQTDPVTCTNISVSPDGSTLSYQFDFGDGSAIETNSNPSHIYMDAGEFEISLIVTTAHGCIDTFNFVPLIKVEEKSSFEIPNAFTPNPNSASSDGVYDPYATHNDIFHPVVRGVKEYELSIYSRWGELVFESKDTKVGWDGYYKGKLCTQDVYIWKIRATTTDNKTINEAGDVLLLKP